MHTTDTKSQIEANININSKYTSELQVDELNGLSRVIYKPIWRYFARSRRNSLFFLKNFYYVWCILVNVADLISEFFLQDEIEYSFKIRLWIAV